MNRSGIPSLPAALAVALVLCGCGSQPVTLPPAPTLYTTGGVPAGLRSDPPAGNTIEVLYATDRETAADPATPGDRYGNGRSTELAFGTARLRIGGERPWSEVLASESDPPEMELLAVEERARFPSNETQRESVDGGLRFPAAFVAGNAAAVEAIHAALDERFAETGGRDVIVFVHGVSNDFETPVYRIAQLWTYLGRPGAAVAYAWPASLRNRSPVEYTYARESGQFTQNHLRQFLESVASHPEVRRIHILAHSRGCDITLSVLRDFRLIYRDDPGLGRTRTKFGDIILAAPDIDLEVAGQIYTPDRVSELIEHLTVYTHPRDTMLGLSEFLFGGLQRLGAVESGKVGNRAYDPSTLARQKLDVIQVRSAKGTLGNFGHTYWIDNPEVLSDIILLLRDDAAAGPEHGRPLARTADGFWILYPGYPGPETTATPTAAVPPHPSPRWRR